MEVLALCRLLERQGKLQGSLNSLQRLALEYVMKWEAENEIKKQRASFDSDILAKLLTQFMPLAAWKLVSGEEEEEYDDEGLSEEAQENRTHAAVPEIDEFTPENVAYMQEILDKINVGGFSIEELDG